MTVMSIFFSFDADAIFAVLVHARALGSLVLIVDDNLADVVPLILLYSYLQPYIFIVRTITQCCVLLYFAKRLSSHAI